MRVEMLSSIAHGVPGLSDRSATDRDVKGSDPFVIPVQPTAPIAGVGQGANSAGDNDSADPEEGPQSNYEQIVDLGFSKFVEDMEAKKKELLREQLLQAMGLTEESLEAMSPDARAAIEDAIAEKIKQRMEAAHVVRNQEDNPMGQENDPTRASQTMASQGHWGSQMMSQAMSVSASGSTGLGPLLALQAAQQHDLQNGDDGSRKGGGTVLGKNDPLAL